MLRWWLAVLFLLSTNGDEGRHLISLTSEQLAIGEHLAFGLLAVGQHLEWIGQWWVPGSQGCYFLEPRDISRKPPRGLELCFFDKLTIDAPWFHQTASSGFAMMPLVLLRKYPTRKFYIIGESTTILNPLALSAWLAGNYDPREQWYIGGRPEHVHLRERWGWDTPYARAGIVLSASGLRRMRPALERCLTRDAPWAKAPGGAWILDRWRSSCLFTHVYTR